MLFTFYMYNLNYVTLEKHKKYNPNNDKISKLK